MKHTINTLLVKAKNLYQQRQLEDAKDLTIQVTEMLTSAFDADSLFQVNLLQAKIENIQGKYSGEKNHFVEALQRLEKTTNYQTIAEQSIEILLTTGSVYLNSKEIDRAGEFFQQAYRFSDLYDLYEYSMFSAAALCQWCIAKNDFKMAERYLRKCQPEGTVTIRQRPLHAEYLYQATQLHLRTHEYSELRRVSTELLKLSRTLNDAEKQVTAMNALAVLHGIEGEYKEAMQYFLDALDISKLIGYRQTIAHCLINIGTIYASLDNHDEALKRYLTIFKEYEDVLDDNTKVIVYNNVGNSYYDNHSYDEAQVYFEKGLTLAAKANYHAMEAHCLTQLSRSAVAKDALDDALVYAERAEHIFQKHEEDRNRPINLVNLAKIYVKLEDYPLALDFAHRGIDAALLVKDMDNAAEGYRILAKIHEKQGDFAQAYHALLTYTKIQEETSQEERTRHALDLDIQYTVREKQQQIESLTRDNEYKARLLEQSEQINKQNSQLIQANAELQQFAYVVSHDLKEPLRMIASYSQLILRRFDQYSDENTETYFTYVREGVIRMSNLLDALLQYATVGKSAEGETDISMEDIVQNVQFNLKLLLKETDARIVGEDLPEIRCIPSLMTQLLQNLVNNAIKFRRPDVAPVITISAAIGDGYYRFSVADNGIGIEYEHLERIFVIFQRLHARNKYEGTGIGLAICQKIVQSFGGHIWATSVYGEGTTFHFTLPQLTEEEEAMALAQGQEVIYS